MIGWADDLGEEEGQVRLVHRALAGGGSGRFIVRNGRGRGYVVHSRDQGGEGAGDAAPFVPAAEAVAALGKAVQLEGMPATNWAGQVLSCGIEQTDMFRKK